MIRIDSKRDDDFGRAGRANVIGNDVVVVAVRPPFPSCFGETIPPSCQTSREIHGERNNEIEESVPHVVLCLGGKREIHVGRGREIERGEERKGKRERGEERKGKREGGEEKKGKRER
eukprot:1174799-Amorphochlora_amoeboformis.AAC.1